MSDFLWVEKYRPQTIDECILPADTKEIFNGFLEKGEINNLLLAGTAGIGKTTIAKALCTQLGVDYIVINGSDEGRFLDTVRNKAKSFASTVSLFGSDARHKVIIVDEASITHPTMYNSLYGRLLRSSMATVDSSSPVTSSTKSSHLSTAGAPSSISKSKETKRQNWRQHSSTVSGLYLRARVWDMIQRLSRK